MEHERSRHEHFDRILADSLTERGKYRPDDLRVSADDALRVSNAIRDGERTVDVAEPLHWDAPNLWHLSPPKAE